MPLYFDITNNRISADKSDGDGLATCHVCSIPHWFFFLVIHEHILIGISATPSGIKRE
jgi:hypothetical protein